MFPFQRLDVYKAAVNFLVLVNAWTGSFPKGQSALADQLKRAALSIPLNIAEGTGKAGRDARRFYGIARGSAFECAALLDVMEVLGCRSEKEVEEGRQLLERMGAMLTKMVNG